MYRGSSASKVKIGIVGFGYWGPKLMRNMFEMPESELCWAVDLDPSRLAKIKTQYPTVCATQHFDDMLLSDVDAVVVATPIRTHYKLAKAALLAGKHVMVEKPLTSSAIEAFELVRIAEQTGRILMVGHTFEYNTAIRALREIVASGEIGDVYYVDSARLNLGLFQPDINVLWDLAPHDISILLYVLQNEPIAVSARGSASIRPGVHDVAYVELRFPDNVLAHVHLSWLDPCKVRRVTIVGSKKMIVCNDLADVEKIRVYDKGLEPGADTDQFREFPLQYRYGSVTIPYIPPQEPLRTQCEHFIQSIQCGTRPQSDGRIGWKVVEILEQADKSLQNGGNREPLALDMQIDQWIGLDGSSSSSQAWRDMVSAGAGR